MTHVQRTVVVVEAGRLEAKVVMRSLNYVVKITGAERQTVRESNLFILIPILGSMTESKFIHRSAKTVL